MTTMMMAFEFLGNQTMHRRGGGGHTNNNNYQSVLVISLPSGVVVKIKTERVKKREEVA
jgi:protein subunit release factor A